MSYVLLIISAALIKYFVQVRFLGICLFSMNLGCTLSACLLVGTLVGIF